MLAVLAALAPGSAAAAREHPYETDELRIPRIKTGGSCVIRNVTIHSAVGPPVVGDVLVVDGRIKAVGRVDAPQGIVEIDGAGRHLAPGVVDCHSHMAIERGLNESAVSISAEVRIGDVVNAADVAIYRALAGGATTVRLLHGSANAIGGQDEILRLRWGRRAGDLRFPGAPRGIKFALGENPRRASRTDAGGRFPASRMGVEAVFLRAFEGAREYQRQWAEHEAAVARGERRIPPRRDLRLEALAGILSGEIQAHCHCYRTDGILMILRTARQYGFRLATLQHVLEGYKVAHEIAESGVGTSTFSDWWSFKVEAYDAIPQNAALLDSAGVLSSLNSDSNEVVRRMYGEAAKSVRYAGMDRVRALALVTANPARQLGIEGEVGSIEPGKLADLVLLSGDPLSSLARVEWTMVGGEIEFQRRDAFGLDEQPLAPRHLDVAPREPLPWNPAGGDLRAITGATIHPVTGPPIEGGTVLFQDGHILAVGRDLSLPASAQIYEAEGKHVWPGSIALDTSLGLREIGSVRATVDTTEIGGNQPDLSVSASIHADSAHFGVTRANGVTRAQTSPKGGGPLRGRSALLRLEGDTWEELVFVDRDMLHLDFPSVPNVSDGDRKRKEPEAVAELRRMFEEARHYAARKQSAAEKGASPPAHDPRLEALAPYARGEKRVAVHAHGAQTILHALRFIREQRLDAALFGAREGWKVAADIAREGIPVVVGPVLALPDSQYDPYDAPFANAAVLQRAGVQIAIMPGDDQNPRNLAFHAAMAAAFGLPREEAVRAITYYPALVLGVEDRLGSIEPGKIADLVVTDGDLLEITAPVVRVFIDGVPVDLENRQSRLYERYRARLQELRSTTTPSGR